MTTSVLQPKPLDTPGGYPVAIAFLPLYHAMGLHSYVFRALLSPSTVVILPKWDVDLALGLIPKCVRLSRPCAPKEPAF